MRFFTAAILVLLLGGVIAAGAYEAGLQNAMQVVAPAAVAAPAAAAPAVAYYGHPYGWGYGFNPFGWLFPLFGLFLFFALMRALMSIGGGGHHRGWSGSGEHGVSRRFEEWHTRAHGDTASGTVPPRQ